MEGDGKEGRKEGERKTNMKKGQRVKAGEREE